MSQVLQHQLPIFLISECFSQMSELPEAPENLLPHRILWKSIPLLRLLCKECGFVTKLSCPPLLFGELWQQVSGCSVRNSDRWRLNGQQLKGILWQINQWWQEEVPANQFLANVACWFQLNPSLANIGISIAVSFLKQKRNGNFGFHMMLLTALLQSFSTCHF